MSLWRVMGQRTIPDPSEIPVSSALLPVQNMLLHLNRETVMRQRIAAFLPIALQKLRNFVKSRYCIYAFIR